MEYMIGPLDFGRLVGLGDTYLSQYQCCNLILKV